MKRLLIVLATALFLSGLNGQSNAVEITRQLKTVTVYPGMARLEYIGTLSLSAGANAVALKNLPSELQFGSVQFKLLDATVSIDEISIRTDRLQSKTVSQEIVRLKQQRDSLQKVLNWAIQQKEILESAEKLLNANQQVSTQQVGVTPGTVQQFLTYYREELTRIRRERTDNNETLNKTQETLTAVQNQIAELSGNASDWGFELRTLLRTQKATRVEYSLSLMTSSADWTPVYFIHATTLDAPLKVIFRAKVSQNTGEDWSNVKLVLSTAQPALDNTQPTMEPRYVYFQRAMMDTVMTFDPVAYNDAVQVVRNEPEEEVWSESAFNLTSSTYTLSANQTILSDAQEHYVTIRELSIPAKMTHYAVPRSSPYVYLLAEIINNSEYDLLPGVARIFIENTYVAGVDLNVKSIADTIQISLGIDQGVVMKRERRDFGASQWLGTYRQETYDFAISLRNNKTVPIEVKLLDQIPLSTDKQIEVSLLKKDDADYDEANGALSWRVRCAPGSTETRSFSYRIKFPKDEKVAGKW
ncbi:MAG: mucoidy inhibitor MuiA family protein [Saprospiraceae bacterium]|nr:mucoidy inhibitor MuiA family protein [Saprospiraceae bacterium]